MKKLLFAGLLFASLQSQAQKSQLSTKEFWQDKPGLETVKTELKGFSFAEADTGDDPLSLAINSDASIDVIKFLTEQPGVNYKKDIHEGRTYLHSAAAKGNAEATDLLLKKGSDINFADSHGQTALTFAAFMGRLTLPVLIVFEKNGLDLKKKYESKNNADVLLIAIGSDKDFSITNYLVSKGLSINAADNLGNNAFNYAVRYGNVPLLKMLAAKNISYNNKDLFAAAQGPFRSANKIDVFQYLVDDLKLNPKATNEAGQNVLHIIAVKPDQDDIVAYFVGKGVDINQADKEGNIPFFGAAGSKDIKFIAGLLPKVADINAVNAKGQSALTTAVSSGTPETISLLIENGADVNIKDKEGKTLAYYLVQSYRGKGGRGPGRGGSSDPNAGFAKKISVLKEKGFNLAAPSAGGNTVLHLAVDKNDPALFELLAPLDIDINAKNQAGLTPLHKAIMAAKNDELLKYLVSHGAKKDVKTGFGETAYALAKENEVLAKSQTSIDFLK